MRRGGFTLLEMLVATLIMGIAVVGLLSNISTSLQHASRLADYDRAALVARRKMNELLLDSQLPKGILVSGQFDPAATGVAGGWRARLTSFEEPPDAAPGDAHPGANRARDLVGAQQDGLAGLRALSRWRAFRTRDDPADRRRQRVPRGAA